MDKKEQGDYTAIEKVQIVLLARKQELEQELMDLNKQRFSDGQVQDVGDQALSSTMDNLTGSIQNNRRDEYHRIVDALRMIAEGKYGVCVDCEEEISPKRLNSFPNATRCIRCQEKYESLSGFNRS